MLEERKPATEETIATTPDKETSNSMHVRVARMARAGGWPAGPGIVADLFDWPLYNAQKMLGGNMATTRAQNVAAFMKKKIRINEAFAGTGTGACTLHQVLAAYNVVIHDGKASSGPPPDVETATSCDIEPVCQKVLASLPEAMGNCEQ